MGTSFPGPSRTHGLVLFLALACPAGGVAAQVPDETPQAGFLDHDTFRWGSTVNADSYNVYRGDLSLLAAVPAKCHGFQIGSITFSTPAVPETGALSN